MSKRSITQQATVNPTSDSASVNALKCQFMTDMELAGMALISRKRYLFAVERLIKHYWRSPAELTEQQVHDYLLERHREDPAKSTFKVMYFALRFFFRETLDRDWKLLKKNETFTPDASAKGARSCRLHANHQCCRASFVSQLS